jgi:hypothetical protein
MPVLDPIFGRYYCDGHAQIVYATKFYKVSQDPEYKAYCSYCATIRTLDKDFTSLTQEEFEALIVLES